MALADLRTVVLGSIAFLVFWVLAVFPSFKLMPVGRTAGAMAGAVLTVVFQILSPTKAYAALDLSILGLLFGTMVVSVYLERADMSKYLGTVLSWKSRGGKDLMCRVCILSAISSTLFTNDTSCVVLTEFVLKLCRQKNLHPKPFLIALATSANIGSVATPIGNPQNLVIAIQSGISFGNFLFGLLPSMLIGVSINTALLLIVYWRRLSPVEDKGIVESLGKEGTNKLSVSSFSDHEDLGSPKKGSSFSDHEDLRSPKKGQRSNPYFEGLHDKSALGRKQGVGSSNGPTESQPPEGPHHKAISGRHAQESNVVEREGSQQLQIVVIEKHDVQENDVENPASPSPPSEISQCCSKSLSRSVSSSSLFEEEKASVLKKWRRKCKKGAVYVVTAGMLAALLSGLDLSWSALTAAVLMMALDFQDASPCFEQVSYPLLVFFAGMFITVSGFNRTGIPGTFWESVEPHARINSASGIAVLALVVMVLSNVASNVPTVLLLGARVSASAALNGASVRRAWLILAWTSTVAGNLTLVGSAANLIVSEQAGKAQLLGYELTFWNHLKFGLPSSLIVAALGLPPIRG